MRLVRWLGIAVLVFAVGIAGTLVVTRYADGPVAVIPGGALVVGELVSGPEPDWSFARDVMEMEFQLFAPPRSRTTWLLVHDERLFIISGFMETPVGRLWKKWPAEAERDGRALIRLEGKRYERRAVRLRDDPALFEAIAAETARKYDQTFTPDGIAAGETWLFELVAPEPS